MTKWSLRIEMQALDTREHHSIYRQVYCAREILESLKHVFRSDSIAV